MKKSTGIGVFGIRLAAKAARRLMAGPRQEFVFRRPGLPEFGLSGSAGVYLHIPFCRGSCPYCPYNKIPYEAALVRPYAEALGREIKLCAERAGKRELSSVYIGGGTPTTMLDELGGVLEKLKSGFKISGEVCLETNPSDMAPAKIAAIRGLGVSLLSVGVQSFSPARLAALGRNYSPAAARSALAAASAAGFKSVNADLMFALPGQPAEEALADARLAAALGADQITVYPLFTFPYTSVGELLRLKKVRLPEFAARRSAYYALYDLLGSLGYERVSVWGFKKGRGPRYSSVTRDRYLGFGAGACSRLDGAFRINTFSVPEYIRTAGSGKSPAALCLDVGERLERWHWFYWRLYDTGFRRKDMERVFNGAGPDLLLRAMKALGLCRETEEAIRLTRKGSFYVHLAQNYFMLDYISRVWSAAGKTPWPEEAAF